MTTQNAVNEFVRQKLRKLRLAKNIGVKQMAAYLGIPCSSYACMESGFYKINLDHLFRILGVLEADITEVWPAETAGVPVGDISAYLKRIQEFRLGEIVSLCGAEGGALFSVRGGGCSALLHNHLSEF
ncbi:MAG TPA: helix-turn-helix transcriptional regulator, partial [Acidobacteriota bacterium]|nr:helix-turn-helix transcriptional regulator [Acidobacteriota bacterium]